MDESDEERGFDESGLPPDFEEPRRVCPRHGDVTNILMTVSVTKTHPYGSVEQFCMPCLREALVKLGVTGWVVTPNKNNNPGVNL